MRMLLPKRTMLVTAIALGAAACGGGGDGGSGKASGGDGSVDKEKGKTLFVQQCGTCHALSDAGTKGSVGPDLDERKPDADSVARQIDVGGGAMPADLVEGEDKNAVAAYVADVAGK